MSARVNASWAGVPRADRVPDQSCPRSATALPCPTNPLSRRNGGAPALRTRADSRPLPAIGCKWDLSDQLFRARLPPERMPRICPALCCRVQRIGTIDEEVWCQRREDWRGRAVRPASASGRQPIPDSGASGQKHAPWRSRTRPPDVLPLQSGRPANPTRCGSLGQLELAAIAPCPQGVSRCRSFCPSNRTARISCLVKAASRRPRRWGRQAQGRKTVVRRAGGRDLATAVPELG